jgi:hypothetical protein
LKAYTDERLEVSNALLVHDLIKNESGNLNWGELWKKSLISINCMYSL